MARVWAQVTAEVGEGGDSGGSGDGFHVDPVEAAAYGGKEEGAGVGGGGGEGMEKKDRAGSHTCERYACRRGDSEGVVKRGRAGLPFSGGLGAAMNAGITAGMLPAAERGCRKRGRGGGSL